MLGALAVVLTLTLPSDGQRVVTVQDPRITESSGLVLSRRHPQTAWTVNDSGSEPVVYGVSTRTGRTRAVLRLVRTDVRDVEALALLDDGAGQPWLCLADIGDNGRVRPNVVLRLLREPSAMRSGPAAVVSLRLRYPNGPTDAETLIWTVDRRLLVVTKDLFVARVYEVPPAAVRRALSGRSVPGPVLARRVASISQSLATDGAGLPDGRLVVRGYDSATIYRWDATALVAQDHLVLPAQPQGETIAAEAAGRSVLVGSEGVGQPLWRVPVAAPASASPTNPSTSRPRAGATSTATAVRPAATGEPPTPWRAAATVLVLAAGTFVGVSRWRRSAHRRRP